MAVSLDGKIATAPLENDAGRMAVGFGCQADHEFVRLQIETADAIITGANSIRASGGVWDQRRRDGAYPLWVVMSRSGLLDEALHFWEQEAIPRVIVSREPVLKQAPNVEYLSFAAHRPAKFLVDTLKARGCENVLLFGGGQINQIFYEEDLVDDLKLTLSPVIVGRSDAPEFVCPTLSSPKQLTLRSSQLRDNHLFLHYSIK
jgi:riboflavin biosynthesis pyrimidine reductase